MFQSVRWLNWHLPLKEMLILVKAWGRLSRKLGFNALLLNIFCVYIGSQLQFEAGAARDFVRLTSTGGVVFVTQKKNAKAIYGNGKC